MAFCQELDPRGTSATDESVSPCFLSCNRSIRVELHGQQKTSNNGALLQRKAPDNSGVINAQGDNLVDLWHPLRIRYSLVSQLGTLVLQRAMGRVGLSDTDKLTLDINGLPTAVHCWIPHLVRRLNESTEAHDRRRFHRQRHAVEALEDRRHQVPGLAAQSHGPAEPGGAASEAATKPAALATLGVVP